MADCLFCKILAGEIPSTRVYEDERTVAIRDVNPQAPTHLLVIPRAHGATLSEHIAQHGEDGELAHLVRVSAQLGVQYGGERGYRVVINEGGDGGQTVYHLHLHVLAGRPFTWPPG
ncbi:histidine triad nucleotide-binding protein [bacterium]|nr:MAG: histidine triad nucleotide-binding protein [bacterium]